MTRPHHSYRSQLVLVTTVVCLSLIGSSCVFPTPHLLEKSSPRANISDLQIKEFKPFETSRSDVLLRLGNPTSRLAEDRVFVYDWRTVDMVWFICIKNCGGGPVFTTTNLLAFEFDNQNRLVDMGRFSGEDQGIAQSKLDKWIDRRKAPTSSATPNQTPVPFDSSRSSSSGKSERQ